MSTELATTEGWTNEQLNLIKSMLGKDLSNDELQLFLYTAKRTGLDPLARQIYAVKRGGRMTIQTGIDGYRLIADRTGKLAGITDYDYDSEDGPTPRKASVTVNKMVEGVSVPFTASARWSEYCAGGPMWQKMPYLMLGKCAEALALRKAFPADLSGVYTAEEMAQADSEPERKAVEAEVSRQQKAFASVAKHHDPAGQDSAHDPEGEYIPPELDWMYQKSSGVLICRLVDVQKKSKRSPAKGEFIAIKLNQQIEGKDLAFYFHDSHRDELLTAKGKVCKFVVSMSADGKFLNVDEVLEIDGQPVSKEEGDPEVKARLLASTLEFTEEALTVLLEQCYGDWGGALLELEQFAAQKEMVTA